MEYIFIYLLQLFERIDIASTAAWFVFAIMTVIVFPASMVGESSCEEDKQFAKSIQKIWRTVLIIAVVLSLIPTKQTLLIMGGTYYGKKAVKAIVTDEKLKKVNTIIELELDKRIKELQNGN